MKVGSSSKRVLLQLFCRTLAFVLALTSLFFGLVGASTVVAFFRGDTMHEDVLMSGLLVAGYLMAKWALELWRSADRIQVVRHVA